MGEPVGAEPAERHEVSRRQVPHDLLATTDLVVGGVLQARDRRLRAGVALGRPLAYALPAAAGAVPAADTTALLLCFPFDLEEMPAGGGYRKIELAVTFDDEHLRAVDLQPGPGWAGPDGTRVTAFGLGRNRLRWIFEAPHADGTLSPDGRWTQVVLVSPSPFTELSGRIQVRGVIEHPLLSGTRSQGEVQTRDDVPFLLSRADVWTGAPLARQTPRPGAWALTGLESVGPPDDELPPGRRHLCLAVDIEKYSARGNADMIRLQRALLRVMRAACAGAAVDWYACGRQAQGDGYLLVLPPDTDDTRVVPRLLDGLAEALAAVNREQYGSIDSRSHVRTRMRAAFHHGIVHEGDSGYAGSAVVELFRMLDSDPLRTLLADDQSTDLVVAFSDRTYQDLVVHGYKGLSPAGFVRTEVRVKQFAGVAWIRSQGHVGPAPHDHAGIP
ncbi:hypothetical protein AB0D71_26990 [Streptomyces avermitilis]|uniref:hypothetical protein n=1 Tax=Streptomyces avermitilis TaxID=33903 RepID=UPI0033F81BAF